MIEQGRLRQLPLSGHTHALKFLNPRGNAPVASKLAHRGLMVLLRLFEAGSHLVHVFHKAHDFVVKVGRLLGNLLSILVLFFLAPSPESS